MIREYIKEFTELKLQIPNLGEEEALGAFMDGLKPWVQLELKRREVRNVKKAISVAESLINFSKIDSSKSKGNGRKSDRNMDRRDDKSDSYCGRKNHGEKEKLGEGSSRPPYQQRGNRSQNYINPEDKFKHPPSQPCGICKGGHWTQKCPKKNQGKTLYSVIVKEGDEEKKEEPKEARLRAIQKVNSVQAGSPPKPSPSAKTLYFVEVKIYRKTL